MTAEVTGPDMIVGETMEGAMEITMIDVEMIDIGIGMTDLADAIVMNATGHMKIVKNLQLNMARRDTSRCSTKKKKTIVLLSKA